MRTQGQQISANPRTEDSNSSWAVTEALWKVPGPEPPANLLLAATHSVPATQSAPPGGKLHTIRPSQTVPRGALYNHNVFWKSSRLAPLFHREESRGLETHVPCPRSLQPEDLQSLAASSHKLNANQVVSARYLSTPTLPLAVTRTTKDPAGGSGAPRRAKVGKIL